MRAICSQEQFASALRALHNIVKHEVLRLYQSVLLTAVRLSDETQPTQGNLTLTSMSIHGTVGMIKHLPVEIEQEGHVLVPIEILTEYISTLRPGRLTLSLDKLDHHEVADGVPSLQHHSVVSCSSASLPEAESSCMRAASSQTGQSCSPSSSSGIHWLLHQPHVKGTLMDT